MLNRSAVVVRPRKPFLDWVADDYDRAAIKESFARALGKGPQLDVLLRRE